MSDRVVLDASVAVKWFCAEDEDSTARAEGVLKDVQAGLLRPVVPEFFYVEVFAVLMRKRPGHAAAAVDALMAMGLDRFPMDREIAQRAERLAGEHALSGYDAIYVALAQLVGVPWLTFDERAARRLATLSICRLP